VTDHRTFPPSPRRRSLARQAGLTAVSPLLVGGVALGVAASALVLVARSAAAMLGGWVAAACDGHASLAPSGIAAAVGELAAPLAGAIAFAALAAHLAQTRALWLPRRRVPDAPVVPPAAVRRTALELAGAVACACAAVCWLWAMAPRLAGLFALGATSLAAAAGALVASLLATLAIAWLVLGALDALVRHAGLKAALAMTPAEKREDDRLAAADPRWRARRAAIARGPAVSDAIAGATVVLLGADAAVAIAWDPVRRPVPIRLAAGRRARATQLVGLARRHGIAVHRDLDLAHALVDGEGRVPDAHWARLAEIVAAVRGRRS